MRSKDNNSKKSFKVTQRISLLIILWVILVTCILIIPFLRDSFNDLRSLLYYIVFTDIIFLVTLYNLNKIDKTLIKEKIGKDQTIYDWTDELNGAHNLLYKLLNVKASDKILTNMNTIKGELLHYCENDTNNLRLLKSYFDAKNKHNQKQMYFQIVITVMLALGVSVVRLSFSDKETENEYIKALTEMDPFILFMLVLAAIIVYVFDMTVGKYRENLIKSVLEDCIEEKKEEQNKN